MTALRIATGRNGLLALFALVAIAAGLLAMRAPAAEPQQVTERIEVDVREARALVAATSGPAAAEMRASGDQARMINASLPFSQEAVQSARPFAVSAGSRDHDRALLCLTQAVYYEAGFEPMAGRRAVAQVVLNRMRHPAYPKSVCGVVYQGASAPVCQFSFTCDGSLDRAPAAAAWRQARDVALAALSGHVEQPVGSATHYHADYVAPRWAPMLSKVAQIGAHIFYRWPGAWGRRAAFTGRYAGEANDAAALRPASRLGDDAGAVAIAAAPSAPPVARAANDVGGLLDTSKGWTLSIPSPDEVGTAAARTMAAQQVTAAAPVGSLAASAAPIVAAR